MYSFGGCIRNKGRFRHDFWKNLFLWNSALCGFQVIVLFFFGTFLVVKKRPTFVNKTLQERKEWDSALFFEAFYAITSHCSVNICMVGGPRIPKCSFNHMFISVCPEWTHATVSLAEQRAQLRSDAFTVQSSDLLLLLAPGVQWPFLGELFQFVLYFKKTTLTLLRI